MDSHPPPPPLGQEASPEPGPAVVLRPVTARTRPVLERLVQPYVHDLSAFRGDLPGPDGTYAFSRLPLFLTEPDRDAFLFHRGDQGPPVGFALTRGLPDGARSIAGFFVVRGVRRQGVGRAAALRLLRETLPGGWGIAFQTANRGAPGFWRGVADAAVGDAWREEVRPVEGHPAPDHWILLDTTPPAG